MQLTVRDVAELLSVSEKTVYRWIEDRKLPGYRLVGGQYRFQRGELLEWATANRVQVSPRMFEEPEAAGERLPDLAEALQAGGIYYRLSGTDKATALRSVVEVLRLPDEVDREFLWQVMLAREALQSTAIGDGIAIPHVRNPIVLHVPRPLVTLCFLEKAVDFGSLDGRPVQALFTLVAPTVRAHLHLLSRLAFALRNKELRLMIERQAGREDLLLALRQVGEGWRRTPAHRREGEEAAA
jgi:PTS system nitrogen regulatory IIA component